MVNCSLCFLLIWISKKLCYQAVIATVSDQRQTSLLPLADIRINGPTPLLTASACQIWWEAGKIVDAPNNAVSRGNKPVGHTCVYIDSRNCPCAAKPWAIQDRAGLLGSWIIGCWLGFQGGLVWTVKICLLRLRKERLLMMQLLERESWALHTWWSSELERS